MDSPTQPPLLVRFGTFELDPVAGELREAGVLRKLHPQPFRVLLLLALHPNQVVTRAEIRRCLWGERKYLDFERGINFCINQIRTALREDAQNPRFIGTLPRRGYRFLAPAVPVLEPPVAITTHVVAPARTSNADGNAARAAAIIFIFAGLLAGDAGFLTRVMPKLTAKDSIVIADFSNTTGDAVFDDALKQALIIQLKQSPFLNVLPDARAREVLRMMKRGAGERTTPEVGRELCLRTGSAAVVDGRISRLGSRYLVDVNAIACSNGALVANEQVEAWNKEGVLEALSRGAANLRAELGESLPSVQKYDKPVEATTNSLDALKNYSVALRVASEAGDAPSIPFYLRAIELDPNFPLAYAGLASRYNNLDQPTRALVYATKAYELRDQVSERERLLIASRYFRLTGDLEKLTPILKMWIAEYPRDATPHGSLGANYVMMGQYEKARAEWEEALQLGPDDVAMYENLAPIYLALNRLDQAKAILDAALLRRLDGAELRWMMYYLAFVQRDAEQMQRQVDWALGRPGTEDILLSAQSDTEAYFGRLGSSRSLSRRAVESAVRSDDSEAAALWKVNATLREAEFGDNAMAKSDVKDALALAAGRNTTIFAALVLARVGETAKAEAMVKQLEQDNRSNSVLAMYRLPSIKAAIALSRGNPRRALELLDPAKPFDLAQPSPSGLAPLYPAYLRGQAYLALHNGVAAATEFQKVLDHPGIALNFPLSALAHLQLARAYVLAREPAKGRTAYQEFLTLWKDADQDIPILISAKSEFAKLSGGQRCCVSTARLN
jgi:eukaryotic-like serine/threonine-protein kinase